MNRSDPNAYRERGGSVVQDAVSGKMSLSKTHFDNFHTYGCWWSPSSSPGAKDGFIRFYMDGVPWYEVQELVLQVRGGGGGLGSVCASCGKCGIGVERKCDCRLQSMWTAGGTGCCWVAGGSVGCVGKV